MKLDNPLILKDLRKFYFELNWTHAEVQQYLRDHYSLEVYLRTLKRWKKNLSDSSWTGPKRPVPPKREFKANPEQVSRICRLRKKTGWGSLPLKYVFKFDLSESTYKRIIRRKGLSRGSLIENQRIHWIKWQRDHPDSLWQLDAYQDEENNWMLPVIDDCSRYCFAIRKMDGQTTVEVTMLLEQLFKIHGVPRELLTDNGIEFGGTSKNSEFDNWCSKWGIKHIRSRIHKPTTAGKVERHHQTTQSEISFCRNDLELFRYRYNHIRPHQSLHMKTPAEVYFDLQVRLKEPTKKKAQKW
jgi:transposase InsO family protein